ncbi:RagB/SusD family nutrient uptake outer membrane protein [Spirosoma radiotolerans]|uniref:Carbohydrate-binding protein SusD n=1 Tax=Spirosoma radiotolerans TaxID=1379870 RepID=A0A0E3ZU90_9BACT|nr:RagB/SusD family nutrient uptake outer membrane protein [Spirosoma radiotolerans]AKD55464.1 carbohydrate-binding protein SusD [Spirosoma radiotolerans]
MNYTKFVVGLSCCLVFLTATNSCTKEYLEVGAIGATSETTLANKAGVNGLLVGAYSLLDGWGVPNTTYYFIGVSNWIYGGVTSDDAHTGTQASALPPMESVESYKYDATMAPFNNKWIVLYAGVQRANDVLRLLAKVTDNSMTAEEIKQIKAEATFLRAVYHFEAAKLWENVPYLDETVSYANANYNVGNTASVWSKLEADFKFAADNLSATKSDPGRANSWAAKAFLAKVYMFQDKYAEAKPVLADVIANGVTASGLKYALVNFADNFNPSKKNSAESVFAVQMSIDQTYQNGNYGDALNFPMGGPATCCGAYQPSFSLVNSYKTDPNTGLPLLTTFNDSDITNDQGLESSAPFTPYTGTLDARLDYTVGRRGIPYLDWGVHPGKAWIRVQAVAGPYSPIKTIYYQAAQATTSLFSRWTSNNYTMIRFADVLLWAAEVEVEIGSLAQAQTYVNQVRARAANPNGWVKKYVDNSAPLKGFTAEPAANYKVGLYTNEFTANGKDFAREAVRFERKLEFAMEGHRFFDLRRWDNGTGYMATTLNNYVKHETSIPGYDFTYMKGATFTKGKNELYPIPQAQIDLSVTGGAPVLKQNPGY